MANLYRAPGFLLEHLAALPTSVVSASAATVTGRGVERLVDYRQQPPMEFASAATSLRIDVDLGTAMSVGAIFIPGSHNLTGLVTVKSGATQAGATTVRASGIPTFGASFLLTWTPASDRWWRLEMSDSGAWQIPELVYATQLRTPVRGVDGWKQPLLSSVQVAEFPTFEAVALLGPGRRRFELEFPGVELSGDLAIFEQLLEIGRSRPFGFVPPDNRMPAGLWVRLEDDPEVDQVSEVPLADVAFTVKLNMREQL